MEHHARGRRSWIKTRLLTCVDRSALWLAETKLAAGQCNRSVASISHRFHTPRSSSHVACLPAAVVVGGIQEISHAEPPAEIGMAEAADFSAAQHADVAERISHASVGVGAEACFSVVEDTQRFDHSCHPQSEHQRSPPGIVGRSFSPKLPPKAR